MGVDGGDADRGQLLGSLPLVASLAPAEPLAEHRAVVGHEVVLDVDRALGEVDAVDDAMRPRLDRRQPPFLAPLVEPQAARARGVLARHGPRSPPADLAGLGPVPFRRLEHRRRPGGPRLSPHRDGHGLGQSRSSFRSRLHAWDWRCDRSVRRRRKKNGSGIEPDGCPELRDLARSSGVAGEDRRPTTRRSRPRRRRSSPTRRAGGRVAPSSGGGAGRPRASGRPRPTDRVSGQVSRRARLDRARRACPPDWRRPAARRPGTGAPSGRTCRGSRGRRAASLSRSGRRPARGLRSPRPRGRGRREASAKLGEPVADDPEPQAGDLAAQPIPDSPRLLQALEACSTSRSRRGRPVRQEHLPACRSWRRRRGRDPRRWGSVRTRSAGAPARRAQSARKSFPAMTASANRTVAANRRCRQAEWGPRGSYESRKQDGVVEVEDQVAGVPAEDRQLPGRQQLALEDHRIVPRRLARAGRPGRRSPDAAAGRSATSRQRSSAGSKARIRYRQQTWSGESTRASSLIPSSVTVRRAILASREGTLVLGEAA